MLSSASTTSPGAAISLSGVTVSFDAQGAPALDDVSLECAPGEFLVLVGRSGSGKTTILNLVSGLLDPTSGTVEVLGTSARNARSRLGYMFARDALLPWRTAQRNVELGLEILHTDRATRRRIAAEMLERLHLGHAARRLPWQLSQGMRQRVALARTWARDPALLLMDEPFSALDAQTRLAVQEEFLTLWSGTDRSVLLVTHDLTEALLLADRVILLGNGRILREVVVPFARPRSLTDLPHADEFRRLERELWELM
jgi:NitT/TauT family transport system ATP-binding protein